MHQLCNASRFARHKACT
ncbi:hypothetical protein [Methylotenera sp.]